MNAITTTAELAAFCARATGFEFVTVDTEFLRETTYWPKLCLLQVATDDEAVLVDPLAPGLDLAPFLALLADAKLTKVFPCRAAGHRNLRQADRQGAGQRLRYADRRQRLRLWRQRLL